MIRGIKPGLMRLGRIKIGEKGETRKSQGGGEYQLPKKLDHFIITKMQRGPDGNFIRDQKVMDALKRKSPGNGAKLDQNDNLIAIPVRVLYNDPDIIFPTRYAAYSGKTCVCSSADGITGNRMHSNPDGSFEVESVECRCAWLTVPDKKGNRRCKPNGHLSVVIRGMPQVGGCHVFRTTSWNTIESICGSLLYIGSLTNGLIAGLDLQLIVRPQTVTNSQGKSNLAYIVSLIYPGDTDSLRNQARIEYQNQTGWSEKQKLIESRVSQTPFEDDDTSIPEEFYPEESGDEDRPHQNEKPDDNHPEHGPNVKNLIALDNQMSSEVSKALEAMGLAGRSVEDFTEEEAESVLKWVEENC